MVMVLVAEDANAGGKFDFGIVGISHVLQEKNFPGQRRKRFDFATLFRFLAGYDPAISRIVAAKAFGVAEFHSFFQGPAEQEIVFGEELVESCSVFFEFRVIEIGRKWIEENFVPLGFDQQPGHRGDFAGGPIEIAREAREYSDDELGFLDNFFNGHLERDFRMLFFFRLLVRPGDRAAVEPGRAWGEWEKEFELRLGSWLGWNF